MEKTHSSVSSSCIHASFGRESSCAIAASRGGSDIPAATLDDVKFRALRLQRFFKRGEEPLRLLLVVGQQIADVDIDGDKAVFGPRVNGEMRFGKQHRAGHALRLELVEAIAYDREAGIGDRFEAQRSQ